MQDESGQKLVVCLEWNNMIWMNDILHMFANVGNPIMHVIAKSYYLVKAFLFLPKYWRFMVHELGPTCKTKEMAQLI